MAFGFIKKVFSFGKKPAEEVEAEAAAVPAVEARVLEPASVEPAQPPAAEVPASEIAPSPAEEQAAERPAEPAAQPIAPTAEAAPQPLPAAPQEPTPGPRPDEPAPEPSPAEPEPEPVVPEPAPVEVPEPPYEVPPEPAELPETFPAEIPASTLAPAEQVSEHEAAVEPQPPSEELKAELPSAEILPPLRQPSPVEIDPLRDEAAPEITPIEISAALAEVEAISGPQEEARPVPSSEPKALEAEPTTAQPLPSASVGKVTVSKKVEQKAEPVAPAAPEPRLTWFQRLKQGLSRSSKELSGSIAGVFTKRKLDEDTLEELEDVLIRADLGMETAIRITDALSSSRYGKDVSDTEVRTIMAEQVEKVLKPVAMPLELDLSHKPHVILVVGVNGTGKTTTIGKLAAKLTEGGLSVMLAAGDTFRAAAIEQLKIWGERTGSPVISSKLGADAAGLAYDAFEKAKAAGSDVLIIDTAGRLQNKAELMAELEKIVRVLGKLDPEAPHTVLQTVDATTGQNALNQVEIFRNIAGVNGLVMTKLDGTARGGILVAIAAKHRLPVYFIGVGEQVDDLEPFSASDFAKAIAGVA
ncbi:signal recognition particle-docking protein FtsY [Mesorhizobium sp. KR1-2]|uniref:signal recognition particle-docking protein FtsY n=1 Tax=Mesorhizobium sp. KR1-2 TaxID=3156609 RepID=UPI0032B5F88B